MGIGPALVRADPGRSLLDRAELLIGSGLASIDGRRSTTENPLQMLQIYSK
jgi:hypothetical protein